VAGIIESGYAADCFKINKDAEGDSAGDDGEI